MLTGYREVPNGDIFVKIYEYSCDRCDCYIGEAWPRHDEGEKNYCGDCAYIIGLINEETFKKNFCYWLGTPFRAYIDNGEVKLIAGKKTPIDREVENSRSYPEYTSWRKSVLERDDYTCQRCNKTESKLEVHHIKSFKHYLKSRTEVSNGITLCKECHKLEHRK